MRVSNISFSSSISNNRNKINYECNGCGKRKLNDFNSNDTYVSVESIKHANKVLEKALSFACAIIAATSKDI